MTSCLLWASSYEHKIWKLASCDIAFHPDLHFCPALHIKQSLHEPQKRWNGNQLCSNYVVLMSFIILNICSWVIHWQNSGQKCRWTQRNVEGKTVRLIRASSLFTIMPDIWAVKTLFSLKGKCFPNAAAVEVHPHHRWTSRARVTSHSSQRSAMTDKPTLHSSPNKL